MTNNLSELRELTFDPDNVDYNEVKTRNKKIIDNFINKYSLKVSYERLMKEFVYVYPFAENDLTFRRFRIMGTKITYKEYLIKNEEGGVRMERDPYSKRKSREQLVLISKKKIDSMSLEKLEDVAEDFISFSTAFEQLRLFNEIVEKEYEMDGKKHSARFTAHLLLPRDEEIKKMKKKG